MSKSTCTYVLVSKEIIANFYRSGDISAFKMRLRGR